MRRVQCAVAYYTTTCAVGISEIRLLGRVGRDPVAYPHVTGDGQIVFFSVATSFPAKTRAEDGTSEIPHSHTHSHRVVPFPLQ